MSKWQTMDSFVPPKMRPFNADRDHATWFWVTWGGEPTLARFEPPSIFVPVVGGMIVGAHPKFWMPLEIPAAPYSDDVAAEVEALRAQHDGAASQRSQP
jgi:hypothetical protein